MNNYCRKLIGDYLKEFIDIKPGYLYSDEVVIKQGIGILINNGIFTPKELKKDIARKCAVIIPLDDIKKWAKDWE